MNKKQQIEVLTDENFDQIVLKSSLPVFVKFFADWSGPCHIMLPILDDLAAKYSKNVEFFGCDIDRVPKTAKKYAVQTAPTLLIFIDGEIIDRSSGMISKSELDNKLQKLLENSLK